MTALDKVKRVIDAAKAVCHHTSPETTYSEGQLSVPFVDAIYELRHAVADAGETSFATLWFYDLEMAHDGTFQVIGVSVEGVVMSLDVGQDEETAKSKYEVICNAPALAVQPCTSSGWRFIRVEGPRHYQLFFDQFDDRTPYDFVPTEVKEK